MKILVTGGTGYIGSHTVIELYSEGYEVVIIDDLSNSSISILDQIEKISSRKPEFYQIDLCDRNAVLGFAESQKDISGIIHFAASKAVGESVEFPLKYYKNNLLSLLNTLEAFPNANFVFSSSCTVYGEPDSLPVNEQAQVKTAESPYGNTKQIAEEILKDLTIANNKFKVAALRYFNPVGAHSSALIGELPIGVPQNLVPFITQSAIGKRGPITVYGNDYSTPDGSAIRDYIHVSDVASAHVAALTYLSKDLKNNFNVFNIGTGKGNSVLEVIRAFEQSTGEKLNYNIGPRRTGDISKIYGDVTLAEKELSWKATRSIEDMLSSAWKWQKYIDSNPF